MLKLARLLSVFTILILAVCVVALVLGADNTSAAALPAAIALAFAFAFAFTAPAPATAPATVALAAALVAASAGVAVSVAVAVFSGAVVSAGALAAAKENKLSFWKLFVFLLGDIILIASTFFILLKGQLVLGAVVALAAIAYPLVVAGIDFLLQYAQKPGLFAKKQKVEETAESTAYA